MRYVTKCASAYYSHAKSTLHVIRYKTYSSQDAMFIFYAAVQLAYQLGQQLYPHATTALVQ